MSVEDFFGSLTNVSFHCLAFANTLTLLVLISQIKQRSRKIFRILFHGLFC